MVDHTGTNRTTPSSPEWRRRREAALAGHDGDERAARLHLSDPSGVVRGTALAALARIGDLTAGELTAALEDPDPSLRRRACEVAAGRRDVDLLPLLSDAEPAVAEAAAWALGELGGSEDDGSGVTRAGVDSVVEALATVAAGHEDPLCREAAVAALGALGDPRGLPAILAATTDKPAVRRRAVIALAPFNGAEVRAALERALGDRDWQVRQAAEDLLAEERAGGEEGR